MMIRRLNKNDLDDFYRLRLDALKNSPRAFRSSYEETKLAGTDFFEKILMQEGESNVIYGAFFHDKLVGSVGMYQENHPTLKHKCNLWTVYVQPNYRNQGIGTALIKTSIEHAKNKMNCVIVNLMARSTSDEAIKLYESLGFRIWGREPKSVLVDGKFYDEYYMSLMIDSLDVT